MANFLYGKDLTECVEKIIFHASEKLLIVSPYIKLDSYFKNELFNQHKDNPDLHIIIVFGKNASEIDRSFNIDDFEYFKEFPNISMVFVPNLHAKYYANEEAGVITSINLYDYSFKNNIEFGVLFEGNIFRQSKIDNLAWNKTMNIIEYNYAVFNRIPTYKKKVIGKDYMGSTTQYDVIDQLIKTGDIPKKNIFDFDDHIIVNAKKKKELKLTREEFEEVNKIKEDQKDITPKQKSQQIRSRHWKSDKTGYCVFCTEEIPLNPKNPYCLKCENKQKYLSDRTKIHCCHICGELHEKTLKYPAHLHCYRKTKDSVEY